MVTTDTAGPGGELTVDLVPGPADRVGAGRAVRGAGPDPSLPAGTIRVVVNDSRAYVRGGAPRPRTTPSVSTTPGPRRGARVLHRLHVLLNTRGGPGRYDRN